jgi:hypothetical protein
VQSRASPPKTGNNGYKDMIHQSTQRLIHGIVSVFSLLASPRFLRFLLRFQATLIENIKPHSEKIHQKTKNQPFFFRLPETKKMRRKKIRLQKEEFFFPFYDR